MSTSDVARSERVLAKVGAALGITPQGAEWLKCAVDPFHDTPLNVCGYPDTNEAASVVQVVRLSTPIAVPASITANNNWDCHIHFFPWLVAGPGLSGVIQTNSAGNHKFGPIAVSNINGTVVAKGGLMYCSVPSGAATYDSGATGDAIPINPFETSLNAYLNGEYRIIGCGYEVINTTSALNVQGLVTVYRQPFPDSDSAKTNLIFTAQEGGSPAVSAWGYASLLYSDYPPENSGTALLLDGSKQWKAAEGCYIANTLNSEEIPTGIDVAGMALFPPTTDTGFVTSGVHMFDVSQHLIASVPPTSTTNNLYAFGTSGLLPTKFNQSGAYFTGLSYTTTLTLNTIWYIERFPSQQDTDLVVLAKHSCRSDTVARSLYSEIVREMPVGVPQRMNGMGEWFADAVSSAVDYVAPVLSAIPTPMTQGLGALARGVGGVAKSLGSKRESESVYSAKGVNTTAAPNKVAAVLSAVSKKMKKKKKAKSVTTQKKNK